MYHARTPDMQRTLLQGVMLATTTAVTKLQAVGVEVEDLSVSASGTRFSHRLWPLTLYTL